MFVGRTLPRARLGTFLTFALAGALCGVWVTRLPSLAGKLDLGNGQIGVVIFVWGAAAILAMQGLRRTIARIGSRATLRISAPLCALGIGIAAAAPSYGLLLAGSAVFGLTFGLVDVGMNAQGTTIEQAYGRPLLNGMHAGWSLGAMTGGLAGSLTAALHLPFTGSLLIVSAVAVPAALLLGGTYVSDPAQRSTGRGRRRTRLPGVVYLIGALAFAAFMLEGSIADWSALYLHDDLGATAAVAALGYPFFEAAMLTGRLAGDRVRTRLGTRRLLALAGLTTAGSVMIVVLAPSTPVALAGFALAGATVCTVVPVTLSLAASEAPGQSVTAVAQVSAFGYGGLLAGPFVIGLLADATTLRVALATVIALGLLIAAGSRRMPGVAPQAAPQAEPSADPVQVTLRAAA